MKVTLRQLMSKKKILMTKSNTYNFCAGPAALPKPVLLKAQQELLDWQGLGISVMEISHRSAEYKALAEKAEADLRKLMGIGDDYAVLFLHGGASHQFANIPMSLLDKTKTAEYITNGMWSNKAAIEASRFGHVNQINALDINQEGMRSLTDPAQWKRSDNAVYTHYTPNETIEGIYFNQVPTNGAPIVADMSSCILSEEIDINQFDLIYAGAQKNIGPAGMTIVIVKRSLFNLMNFDGLPNIFNYQKQSENGSMINTPPTYAWYLASLVFEWLIELGGVAEMGKRSQQKASILYSCIDQDDFYRNPIAVKDRSKMNVPFILKDESLNTQFLNLAKSEGLVGLEGHRSVGGMRASLYNSMPVQGVEALTDFMLHFKKQFG